MLAEHGYFYSRHPQDQRLPRTLRAGEPVVANRSTVELALWERDSGRDSSAPRVRLPFGSGVQRVRVSPEDLIVPGFRRLRIEPARIADVLGLRHCHMAAVGTSSASIDLGFLRCRSSGFVIRGQ